MPKREVYEHGQASSSNRKLQSEDTSAKVCAEWHKKAETRFSSLLNTEINAKVKEHINN